MSTKTKSRRWNVAAIADGVKVKFVVRGDTKEIAEKNARNNYKGITKILSLEERKVSASFPVSEEALKTESYTFKMRHQKRHNRKKFYG